MHQTTKFDIDCNKKILLTTQELQALLGCGRASAVKIGEGAEAKIVIGKRILWHREKIQKYTMSIAI